MKYAPLVALVATASAICSADDVDLQKLGVLAGDLKAKSAKVRKAAAEEIGKLGKAASPAARQLCDAVLDPNRDVSLAAFSALEKVSPEVHKPLATIMLDRDESNKLDAIKSLGKLGEKAQPLGGVVTQWLVTASKTQPDGPDRYEFNNRVEALTAAVVKMRPENPDDIKAFMKLAGPLNKNSTIRLGALKVLTEWAERGKDERRRDILPVLKSGLTTGMPLHCLEAAGSYGDLAADLLPTIRELKLSSDKSIRDAATKAAAKIEAKK